MIIIADKYDKEIPYVMRKMASIIIENGKITKNRFIGELPAYAPSIGENKDEITIVIHKEKTDG